MDDTITDPRSPDRSWARHPADRARLVAAASLVAVGCALAAWRPRTVRAASADLVRLLGRLPEPMQAVLAGGLQLAAVGVPVAVVGVLLWRRRVRLLGVLTGTAATAGVSMALLQRWLDRIVPASATAEAAEDSWLAGQAFPSGTYLAAATAAATVVLPGSPTRWRRWIVGAVAVAATCRLLTATAVPVNVVVTLSVGAAVGSLALVVLGAPTRRASASDAAAGAARAGAAVTDLRPLDHGAGTRHFTGTHDGRPVRVTLVGRDDRDAEMLARVVRRATTRDLDAPPLRLRGTTRLEHEALVSLAAGRVVAVPDVLGVAATPEGDAVLVTSEPAGLPLDDPAVEVDHASLVAAWSAVARLRERRIAHGALTLAALRTGRDGPLVTGFGAGAVGAEDRALDTDVANLLLASAARVGAVAAVVAAVASPLPRAALEAALPLVQPNALVASTRQGVEDLATLCAEVRGELQTALDVGEVELLDLTRITPAKLVSAAGTVFLAALLVLFVGNVDLVLDALADVDWTVLPVLVAIVTATTMAGAWGLQSAVLPRLPFLRTCEVMLAQGFLNRFTPANAGGMALRARYLQGYGVELTSAATSVGLTSAAQGVAQVAMLVGAGTWAGSTGEVGFSLPDVSQLAGIGIVVTALGGALYLTPWGRRVVFGRLGEVVGGAWRDLRELAVSPGKVFGLFGSAVTAKSLSIVAFAASCAAADVHLATSQLAFLYLTAGTVAGAAPTPGGVGAIEAAQIAALTGAGVDSTSAVSAVVVFRLATYWLPVPPSYLALRRLRAIGAV